MSVSMGAERGTWRKGSFAGCSDDMSKKALEMGISPLEPHRVNLEGDSFTRDFTRRV
jgi:hypothetical protein